MRFHRKETVLLQHNSKQERKKHEKNLVITACLMLATVFGALNIQAQQVNVFDESSIGMGDSIDQVRYQVVYDTKYIYNIKKEKEDIDTIFSQEQMILQIGNNYSAFYSYPIYQRDSLISYNMSKGIDSNFSGTSGTINWKVYKNYPKQGKTAYLDFFAADRYLCIEPMENIDWLLTDNTDTICGYPCHEAIAKFKGRTWKAWYAEDIPLDNGPWKLGGLPGLILKACDTENDYTFTAIGLTQGKVSTPIYYKGKTFEPIDRKSLTSLYKKYYADPIGYLFQNKKYANVIIKDDKGNILKHSKKAEPYNPIER